MNYEQIKETLVARGKEKSACADQYKRLLKASNIQEVLKVVADNFVWCCNHGVIEPELLTAIGNEELNKANIWFNQNANSGYLYAYGSATVRAYGSATVIASDSATVIASDSATVEASGSAYINSYSNVEHKVSDKAILRYYYTGRIVLGDGLKKENVTGGQP